MKKLPPEAHAGLMRVWLEILREKHPHVAWVAAPEAEEPDTTTRGDPISGQGGLESDQLIDAA